MITLPGNCTISDFICQQTVEWGLLKNNIEIFDTAEREDITINNSCLRVEKILLNYRKSSLSADLKSIAGGERPCFLCPDSRPDVQKSLDWNDYGILVNPYPASKRHLTIVSNRHEPQILGDKIYDMVLLTHMIPDACIFYNGAKCGASAPDHRHFQAVDISDAVNFSNDTGEIIEWLRLGNSKIYISRPEMSFFGYFIIELSDDKDLYPTYNAVMDSLPATNNEEPLVNVMAFKTVDATRIIIVPRRKHRPNCYGVEEDKFLISPASLEIMGRFITSRPEDFCRLDGKLAQSIYHEVCYTHDEIIKMLPI